VDTQQIIPTDTKLHTTEERALNDRQ